MPRHVRTSSREGGRRALDCRPSEMIQYAGKGKRMKAKTLVFKFDGPDVNMQAFGRDFVSLFNNVYQLVESCSDDAPCVTAVENNCITIRLICSAAVALAFNCTGSGTVKNPIKYNAAVRGINSCLHSHHATLEYRDGDEGRVCQFGEAQELPAVAEAHCDVHSTMTIYGELVDVGGANPNAHIRSDAFEDDVKIDIDRDLAKRLASRLYEQVGINAAVVVRGGKVISGKALSVVEYDPKPIDEWLLENEGALGVEAFKGIDINAFIAEQRA